MESIFFIEFLKLKLKEIGIFLSILIPTIFLCNLIYFIMDKIFLVQYKFNFNFINIMGIQFGIGLLGLIVLIISIFILIIFFHIIPEEFYDKSFISSKRLSYIIIYIFYILVVFLPYFLGKFTVIMLNINKCILDTWAIGLVLIIFIGFIFLIIYGLQYWIKCNIKKAKLIVERKNYKSQSPFPKGKGLKGNFQE